MKTEPGNFELGRNLAFHWEVGGTQSWGLPGSAGQARWEVFWKVPWTHPG